MCHSPPLLWLHMAAWQEIGWLVKTFSSCEVSECGWKVINWVIKCIPIVRWVSVDGSMSTSWLNEHPVEMSECRWKFINRLIELIYWISWNKRPVGKYKKIPYNNSLNFQTGLKLSHISRGLINFQLWGTWVWLEVYQLVGWNHYQLSVVGSLSTGWLKLWPVVRWVSLLK
jgi:hypothetical protein